MSQELEWEKSSASRFHFPSIEGYPFADHGIWTWRPMTSDERDSAIVNLLTEHQLGLRLYVQSLLPGDPSAPDVTQQANTTIWKKRADFALGTNFKAWAFAIARYEVLNYRKQQARDSRLMFSDELEEIIAAEMEHEVDDIGARQGALQQCLQKLKPKDRELIRNRYFERTPLRDYAETIGRSPGGLKVTLHRLRHTLRLCIERQMPVKEGGRST